MSRKQRITISIVGIVLVALILVGVTYAYFITNIDDNEKEKSIDVQTAVLEITYGDGTGILKNETELIPNATVGTKTFTVTNTGDDLVENYTVYIENVTNELVRPQDLVYTVTCTSYVKSEYESDSSTATKSGTCKGVTKETQFPIGTGTGMGIIVTNSIAEGLVHEYKITLKYLDPNVDQSDDMYKTIEGKINIKNVVQQNPYSDNKNTLAYKIIDNATGLTDEEKEAHWAELSPVTLTVPGVENSTEDESILSVTNDDYGISYYFRGNVDNNYVNFAGLCWRIIRIEGDGSIRMSLANINGVCNTNMTSTSALAPSTSYGYTTDSSGNVIADYEADNGIHKALQTWYNNKGLNNYSDKLKLSKVCLGDITTGYDANGVELTTMEKYNALANNQRVYTETGRRFYGKGDTPNPTLLCGVNGSKTSETRISTYSMDEMALAGATSNRGNSPYFYLFDNAVNTSWTSSYGFDDGATVYAFRLGNSANGASTSITTALFTRPVISLISGTVSNTGNGTLTSPYEIN